MEKVRRFFRNFNEKRSYQIVFFIVSMCVILGGYFVLRMKVAEEVSHRYTVIEDINLAKYVEEVCIEEDVLTISGWCFYKDVDSSRNNVQVFLRNLNDEEDIVWLDVETVTREDVDAYFDCEVDYSQSGFLARTKAKKLNAESSYEIFLKLTYFDEQAKREGVVEERIDQKHIVTVSTKRYLSKERVETFRPGEDSILEKTTAEYLNKIFKEGLLLGYDKESDIYIYQFMNKLYWVAGKKAHFEEDGTTRIEFQLNTTRPDLLPEERIMLGKNYDNLAFMFEEKELISESYYPYRVAEYAVAEAYPVTGFWTGYHDGSDWVWREELNLDIRLLK